MCLLISGQDIVIAPASLLGAPYIRSENVSSSVSSECLSDIPLFKYIHYAVTSDSERLSIHRQICNIVRLPKMQQVCAALLELIRAKHIFASVEPGAMLAELRRLGLPDASTPGFSDQNFFSNFKTR